MSLEFRREPFVKIPSLAASEGGHMEQEYWLGRKRASMAKAEGATTSEARHFYLQLAGRHSDMAVAVATQKRRQAMGGRLSPSWGGLIADNRN